MKDSQPFFLHIRTEQKALFCKRLSLYLHAGIPIAQGLHFLSEDANSPSVLYIARKLEEHLRDGFPLSQGMMLFPKQFDAFTVGFVRAGESSGRLSETLERLSDSLRKQAILKQKILSALAYPALIFFGTIIITLFLTLFIFPKILPVLQGFKTPLPFSTRLLLGINKALTRYWGILLFGVTIVAGGFFALMRVGRVRILFEELLIRIPIFSLLFQNYAISIFSRTLALQLEGGIRIVTALELTHAAVPGALYKKAITEVRESIMQGQRFSLALKAHKKLFPPLVCQMIAAGETTGTLSKNLQALAEMYESDLDTVAKNLTVLIEPVLMVCMGCVVGFIALAIITPIYAVTQNLSVT
jgi:type IV pilus assembly protein PilC